MTQRKAIRRFVTELAGKFRPDRVVLFGSRAGGASKDDSDVDLLVVMPHRGPAALQAAKIRQAIPAPFPLDLIVRSPGKIKKRLELGDSFLREIFVVDDGSTDRTWRILQEEASRLNGSFSALPFLSLNSQPSTLN
jgi:predicted nucleotidyltransferase